MIRWSWNSIYLNIFNISLSIIMFPSLISLFCLLSCLHIAISFKPVFIESLSQKSIKTTKKSKFSLKSLNLAHESVLISVADYAAEIVEKSVGTDVYTPIFKAGLFLFLSVSNIDWNSLYFLIIVWLLGHYIINHRSFSC